VTTTENRTAGPALGTLALKEIVRYLRHPVFLVGAVLLVASCVIPPDARFSSTMDGLVPGATLGLFGLVVMVSLTQSSDRAAAAAGAVSVDRRLRTLALAAAMVVPFGTALLWFAASVWRYQTHAPAADAIPFAGMSDAYVYAVLFAQGVMAALGGPVLGLVIGRWWPRRGAAPVAVVVLVLVTILMQGLFASTRVWREIWPWTHFFGPVGVPGDANRTLILTGSPFWYVAYLAALCVIGVLVALLRDDEAPRRGLVRVLAGTGVVAVILCVLTITGGYDETQVNPLPSAQG
jgi:hypothetical protein